MEYLIGLIVALFGGLFYFKNKADKAKVEVRLAETKGRDKELKDAAAVVDDLIDALDDSIAKEKEKRKAERNKRKNMTLKERRDEAKNRYKK